MNTLFVLPACADFREKNSILGVNLISQALCYRHFNLITGLPALMTILSAITSKYKQTSNFEMYAYNCNPKNRF